MRNHSGQRSDVPNPMATTPSEVSCSQPSKVAVPSRRLTGSAWLGAACLSLLTLTGCPEPMQQDSLNVPGQGAAPADPQGAPAVNPPVGAGEAQPPGQQSAAAPADPGGSTAPALRINEVFPNTLTQEAVEKTGNYATIAGTISGSECDGKTMRLDAVEQGDMVNKLVTFLKTDKVGEFKLLVPKSGKKYFILGACDINGDGSVDADNDRMSAYPKNPVTVSGDLSGIEMKMLKPPITEGVLPEPEAARKAPQTANAGDKAGGQAPGAPGAGPNDGKGQPPAGPGGAAGTGSGAATGAPPAGAGSAGAPANANPAANPTSGAVPGVLPPGKPATAAPATGAPATNKPAGTPPNSSNLPGVLPGAAKPGSK